MKNDSNPIQRVGLVILSSRDVSDGEAFEVFLGAVEGPSAVGEFAEFGDLGGFTRRGIAFEIEGNGGLGGIGFGEVGTKAKHGGQSAAWRSICNNV